MDDDADLRHPRAVASVRVVLYVAVAVLLALVVLVTFGFLGALAVVVGVLAVLGEGGLLPVGGVALLALVVVGATGLGLVLGARRVERWVVDADRRPDPVEAVKKRYVDDDIDEFELEARLEELLGDPGDPSRGRGRARDRATEGREARHGTGRGAQRSRREAERGR